MRHWDMRNLRGGTCEDYTLFWGTPFLGFPNTYLGYHTLGLGDSNNHKTSQN